MNDSCKIVRNTLNNINESDDSHGGENGKPPQSIEVENSIMFTDVCDNDSNVGNEKILTRMLWIFLKQITFLEKSPSNFIEFKFNMKEVPNMIEDYLSKFKDSNEKYILSSEYLFKNDESVIQI